MACKNCATVSHGNIETCLIVLRRWLAQPKINSNPTQRSARQTMFTSTISLLHNPDYKYYIYILTLCIVDNMVMALVLPIYFLDSSLSS